MRAAERDITVVIASSENKAVFDCIDSVNRDARIVVSMTPSDEIGRRLSRLGIPKVVVPRGNLGTTFNAGIEAAETQKVIVMTDDSTFNSGTIDKLSESLETHDGNKAKIIFQQSPNISFSNLVANLRDYVNSNPNRAYTPGLGLRKSIKDRIGGFFFNEQVRWGEDAEFSHRFKEAGLTFEYVEDATINHPPVPVKHDLKGAFLIGVGKRRAVELGLRDGSEDIGPTVHRIISGKTFRDRADLLWEKGTETLFYKFLWDTIYNAGYNLRKHGLSSSIEASIWQNFGKDK